MATEFPTTLDSYTDIECATTDTFKDRLNPLQDAIEALETKVGVNSSAVATSIDYKLTNTASSNPGHKHTLANGATDVTATAAEVNVLDGLTSSTADLNLLDGSIAGTGVASMALVLNSSIQADLGTGDIFSDNEDLGWIPARDTLVYSGYTAATRIGVVTIAGVNRTTKYRAGTRLKFTQSVDGVKYGIVMINSTFSTDTTITFQTPVGTDLDNAAITLPYFSREYAPSGIDLATDLWFLEISNTSNNSQATPTQNTWYNPGTISLAVPVGKGYLSGKCHAQGLDDTVAAMTVQITLGTANNSADDNFSNAMENFGGSAADFRAAIAYFMWRPIFLTSAETRFMNIRTTIANAVQIDIRGDKTRAYIRWDNGYI